MYDDFPGVDRAWSNRRILTTPDVVRFRVRTHQPSDDSQVDIVAWTLGRFNWRGGEHVLDVSCGAGHALEVLRRYLQNGRLVAGDITLGLLHHVSSPEALPRDRLVMDVQDLPFGDDVFDIVLASYVLHQIPDINRAVEEMRRVLRPGGVLLVAANGSGHALRLGAHLMSVDDLYRRAYGLLGVPHADQVFVRARSKRFQLDNGSMLLARHFHAVARYDLPVTLTFHDIDTVLLYLESTRTSHEPDLPPGIAWDALMQIMRAQVEQIIGYFGKMEVDNVSGILVATDLWNFAAPPKDLREPLPVSETLP
ncbi:MAG: methyltransferase domain-containing protein [Anaerolineae bacterium]|nr:methyltransferase domain-containing protein [Anaerolineae bacterium]